MSDNKENNITPFRIIQGSKKKDELSDEISSRKQEVNKAVENLTEVIIQPGDFEGFFRVIELLRTFSDEIDLKINKEEMEIISFQFSDETIEVKGKQIKKNVKVGNVIVNLNIPTYFVDSSHEDWYTHVTENAEDLEKMILSLVKLS